MVSPGCPGLSTGALLGYILHLDFLPCQRPKLLLQGARRGSGKIQKAGSCRCLGLSGNTEPQEPIPPNLNMLAPRTCQWAAQTTRAVRGQATLLPARVWLGTERQTRCDLKVLK